MRNFFKIQLSSDTELEKQSGKNEKLIYNETDVAENFAFSAPPTEVGSSQRQNPLNRQQRRQQSQAFKKQRIKI